jgi:hypothetical protein
MAGDWAEMINQESREGAWIGGKFGAFTVRCAGPVYLELKLA